MSCPQPSGRVVKAAARQVQNTTPGQKDWESVAVLLDAKVLRLERTQPVFEEILSDARLSVWLAVGTDYIQHCKNVIFSLPPQKRIKIGITFCPNFRYYEAHYAYSKLWQQRQDGVRYEGMVIARCHVNREVVQAIEHGLIKHFLLCLPTRIANKKQDEDQHINCDDITDSEAEDGPGPFFLYFAYGDPM